jgi:hypothetical protein
MRTICPSAVKIAASILAFAKFIAVTWQFIPGK